MSELVVVSHPAVLAVNQSVFVELAARGVTLEVIVPARWRHVYATNPLNAEVSPTLAGRVHKVSVVGMGRPQRHVYRARVGQLLKRLDPEVLYIEEECFSLAALQFAIAARRAKIPYGLQAWENLDRPLPAVVRHARHFVLEGASFVAARTPAAAARVREWGATGTVEVVGSPVPPFPPVEPGGVHGGFTVGFAGRLIGEKGVLELARTVASIDGARLVAIGDGPLRDELRAMGPQVEVRTGVDHRDMATHFADIDVLALFSHATPTWSEQFGRVLVEAMSCGVCVVGARSGEIPYVIDATGGGVLVDEGDLVGLRAALLSLRDAPEVRARYGAAGKASVGERFSVDAAASGLRALVEQARGARPRR